MSTAGAASSGAYGRDRMMSDRFLSEEMKQLTTMAIFLPAFFLVIAAFLVNIALGRVIATERSNIGLLKAFGYSDLAVAWHYAKSALMFGLIGASLGSIAGVVLGRAIADIYRDYYHFPALAFSAGLLTFAGAWAAAIVAVSIGAILMGIFGIVRGFAGANYTLALWSTFGLAASQPFLLNAWTKVPANWFAIEERA